MSPAAAPAAILPILNSGNPFAGMTLPSTFREAGGTIGMLAREISNYYSDLQGRASAFESHEYLNTVGKLANKLAAVLELVDSLQTLEGQSVHAGLKERFDGITREISGFAAKFQDQFVLDARVADLNIHKQQILKKIARSGEQSMSDLANETKCSTAAITGAVDRLEKFINQDGQAVALAERRHSAADRRKIFVHLTEAGRLAIKQLLVKAAFENLLDKAQELA